MNPNLFDFDAAVAAIRQGDLPEGIETVSMDEIWCGTAACLFGVADIMARRKAGLPANRITVTNDFIEWLPSTPRMKALSIICLRLDDSPVEDVLAIYDCLDEYGAILVPKGSTIPKRTLRYLDTYGIRVVEVEDGS